MHNSVKHVGGLELNYVCLLDGVGGGAEKTLELRYLICNISKYESQRKNAKEKEQLKTKWTCQPENIKDALDGDLAAENIAPQIYYKNNATLPN